MSAVLRWRCDVCRSEAEVVEEVPRGPFSFYSPKSPAGWFRKGEGKAYLDLCSQPCVVVHQQHVLTREQAKLARDVMPGG